MERLVCVLLAVSFLCGAGVLTAVVDDEWKEDFIYLLFNFTAAGCEPTWFQSRILADFENGFVDPRYIKELQCWGFNYHYEEEREELEREPGTCTYDPLPNRGS